MLLQLTVRVTRWWVGQDSPSKREKLKAAKSSTNALRTHLSTARCVGRLFLLLDNELDSSGAFLLFQNCEVDNGFIHTWRVDIKAIINRCFRFPQ